MGRQDSPVESRRPVNPKCAPFDGHSDEVHQVIFSPDSRTLASAGNEALYDFGTSRRAATLFPGRAIGYGTHLSLSAPTDERIAAAGVDRLIYFWRRRRRAHPQDVSRS